MTFDFLLFLCIVFPITVIACPVLRKSWIGAELTCCSTEADLKAKHDYPGLCDGNCSCYLELDEHFRCSYPHEGTTKTHCHDVHLPEITKDYEIRIKLLNNHTLEFLGRICHIQVARIVIEATDGTRGFDLNECFPQLNSFVVRFRHRTSFDAIRITQRLTQLKSIKLVNVDFSFTSKATSWTQTLDTFHVGNSSLIELPRWFTLCHRLERLHITQSNLTSLTTIAQLVGLKSIQLSENLINDVHRHAFLSKELNDIDLSYNQITSIGAQTFANCKLLRALNLGHNPLQQLPYKPFTQNNRLKWLQLSYTKIKALSAEHFAGLSSLKSLSMSNIPLESVSPFAFLPLKNLRSLDLSSTNLTRLPSAVTQNCALTHLNLANNLFHRKSSLPPEVMTLLSSLSYLRLDGNPLIEFPSSLLLLSTSNVRLLRQLILTSTGLPYWTNVPCTPYIWHLHVTNRSIGLRQLVSTWNEERMEKEGLAYCKDQYEWMIDQLEIYRDLENSNGCAATRRLRSAMLRSVKQPLCNITTVKENKTESVRITSKHHSNPNFIISPILVVSLIANFCLICLILGFLCLIMCCRQPKY